MNLTLINGNGKPYELGLPAIKIIGFMNDVAIEHVRENTGLTLIKDASGYYCQPEKPEQIVKLFMTYNFKSRYYNNWNYKNTIVLKNDHHVGFEVDSICYNCCEVNHISTNGLQPHQRLSC